VALDPFLYVAFAGGWGAGRLLRWRSPWIERATVGTVVVLLLLLGGSLARLPPPSLLLALPVSALFVGVLLAVTLVFVRLLGGAPAPAAPEGTAAPRRVPVEYLYGASVVVGYFALGRFDVDWSPGIEWALYALLALIAFDLHVGWGALKGAWVPIAAAAAAAPVVAILFVVVAGLSPAAGFATAMAFGWYTLAGPLVADHAGPAAGLIAFFTNFLRESLTLVAAPLIGRWLGGPGIAAAGGATSMDTTLYASIRHGGPDAAGPALATGLVLTVTAGLVLPLLLGLA